MNTVKLEEKCVQGKLTLAKFCHNFCPVVGNLKLACMKLSLYARHFGMTCLK